MLLVACIWNQKHVLQYISKSCRSDLLNKVKIEVTNVKIYYFFYYIIFKSS